MTTTDQHEHAEAMILETRDSAVLADRSAQLDWIDAAIASELDDGTRGSLLLDRAIALQGESDPSRAAADSARAFELLLGSERTDEAAFAAAVAGAMAQRANDVEAAVDYAVEAMALIDVSEQTVISARAANSIATLFAQLSAFEQAYTYSSRAADICALHLDIAPMALSYTACYVGVEARHAGVDVPLDRARDAVAQLTRNPNPIARNFLGPGMDAELTLLEDPTRAGLIHLVREGLDEVAPRLQAWYQLVLATVASNAARQTDAVELLDVALPTLTALGDEHRVVRAHRLRSDTRAALGDMAGALDDAKTVADTVRGWQIDQVGRLAVQITRRAELEQMQSSLQRRAVDLVRQINVDELTQTGSRRLLEARLDELSHESRPVSVAIVDIDQFKQANDDFGHAVGDEVLRQVGSALRGTDHSCSVLARYGGDEFVAVFTESGTDTAAAYADDVMAALSLVDWDTVASGLAIHVSVGISSGPSAEIREVVERADVALFAAKRQGRNRIVID